MNTIKVSATSARNKFFELLNQVALGSQVVIERDNKEIAMIIPKTTKTDWKGLRLAMKKVKGILKDEPLEEIAPARAEDAWGNFGEWDKEKKIE